MTKPILKIKDLFVKFSNISVLESLSMEVEKNDYISIVGPNGSGKSSLLKTILGIIKPDSGTIEYDSPETASAIGYVPQVKTLDRSFPARAIDLAATGLRRRWVGLLGKQDKQKLLKLFEELGAEDYAFKQLSELSGGELQRVYLAKSLAANPKILLLDEPATGIDLVCEATINNILKHYNSSLGTTVIMVTHDISAAYHHTNKTLLLNRKQIYFGESQLAFTDDNLQSTYSHLNHHHEVKIGIIKDV